MQAYLDMLPEQAAPLDRYKAVQAMVKGAPTHREARLALAEAALDAKLWGEAASQLDSLERDHPSVRVFRLRARLAEEDPEVDGSADAWLERAAAADADPAWVCKDCGTVADDWSAVCGNCGAFASLEWSQPPRVHRTALPVGEPAPAAESSADTEAATEPADAPASGQSVPSVPRNAAG